MNLKYIKESIKAAPFFETENGLLYCADCLKIMKQMPDECVDLVVTSPPYHVGKIYGEKEDRIPDYFPLLQRVAKILCVFPGYQRMYDTPHPKITAIWTKQNSMTGGACFSRFAVWEPILFYGDWGNKRLYNRDVFDCPISKQDGVGDHPCPFPLRLVEILVRPIQADTILDPFLGSGTTCVVAERLNRKWVGIEINEEYCKMAVKRIEGELEKKRQGEINFKPKKSATQVPLLRNR